MLDAMETTPKPAPQEPNHYEFRGHDFQIVYSTTSLTGAPQLTVQHKDKNWSFKGDDIRVLPAEIGRLVTVTLETMPDLHTVTLTALIPPVNLEGPDAPLSTDAIRTTMQTSKGGPKLVKGQIAHYEAVKLHGTARFVQS